MQNGWGGMFPVVIDVDTGVDDALALGLALALPELSVIAVTTVAGNVDVDQATQNTRRVLDWFGAVSVPVARGASQPLLRPHRDAREFHGPDGLGGAMLVPQRSGPILDTAAPEVIVRAARRYAGSLRLVCLGPLTNLAIALRLEPRLPELVEGLVIMGGAFAVPGNVTPFAEFNVWSDPEAAHIVAEAGFRTIWVGLDVTTGVRFDRAARERLAGSDRPGPRLAYEVSRWAFDERGVDSFALHDPVAVAVAARPDLVTGERAFVHVLTSPSELRGRTVWRADAGAPALVAQGVNAEAVYKLLRERLGLEEGGKEPTRPESHAP